MILRKSLALVVLLFSFAGIAKADQRQWGDWDKWGDQGDGSYLNPVIPADYSDLDCIRVGADYYAISSTFQFSPGVVIIHSRDLVNWSILGHVVPDLGIIGPQMTWSSMNAYGRGIWAGAIRYHDGKFWVYFCTPDGGYFMSTAKNAAGPWEPLHKMQSIGAGWDDCCPFWDDDGQGYLVGSNFKDGYKIHLWKLTPDGHELVPESDVVIHQSSGSEANKLYKINGVYYHFYSENRGAEGRVTMMERSHKVTGPYTEQRQLAYGQREYREPNQGGLIQTQSGDWYFFTHHGEGEWEGRCASLLPVSWIGGWPIIGTPDAKGIGRFTWGGKMPVKNQPLETLQTTDEFNETALPPQWEWNYQPRAEMWSLTERPGWLRLHAFKPLQAGNLMKAGNTLTQRSFRTKANTVVVKLDISNMVSGQRSGLCHFASAYSYLGVHQLGGKRVLEFNNNGKITTGPEVTGKFIWLQSTWGLQGVSQYAYSLDGQNMTAFGADYKLQWGFYRGDRIGIFNFNDEAEKGYVDIDFLKYDYARGNSGPAPQTAAAARE